jgi:hypothetical protein
VINRPSVPLPWKEIQYFRRADRRRDHADLQVIIADGGSTTVQRENRRIQPQSGGHPGSMGSASRFRRRYPQGLWIERI